MSSCGSKVTDIPVTGVTLNKETLELEEGESQTLTATISPSNATDKTLIWASQNDAVATVQGGKVSACSPGSTTISARAGNASASCRVIVNKRVIKVISVSLSPSSLSLNKGESAELNPTITPLDAEYNSVKWASSNSAIATVSDAGKVSAVGKGTADVLFTVIADYGEFTAKCPVTVTIPANGLSLDKDKASIKPGDSLQLVLTITPEDADTDGLKWQSSNESAVIVDQKGLVTGVSDGESVITVSLGNLSVSCSISCSSATMGGNEGTGFENW